MLNQTSLSETAGGYQCDIVTIGDESNQTIGFLHTVTEVVRCYIALGDKWVCYSHSVLILKEFKLYAKIIIILL